MRPQAVLALIRDWWRDGSAPIHPGALLTNGDNTIEELVIAAAAKSGIFDLRVARLIQAVRREIPEERQSNQLRTLIRQLEESLIS